MFGYNAPRQKAGRPILAPAINRPARAIERLSRSRPGSGLAGIEAAGALHTYSTERRSWLIRITTVGTGSDGTGSYGWQAIAADPDTPGAYLDQPGWVGTLEIDPMWEYNGNAGLAVGTRVEVRRDWTTGEVRVQLDRCGS